MAKQVPWNKTIIDTFIELALLSEEEQRIIITRARDNMPISQQARLLGMSESNVKKKIALLKKKYDIVQKLAPDKLPVRKKSAIETYMDNN